MGVEITVFEWLVLIFRFALKIENDHVLSQIIQCVLRVLQLILCFRKIRLEVLQSSVYVLK